jgi:hypothetical protein
MDFNSGWYLPHVPGIVQALQEIQSWTNIQERYAKIQPILFHRYANDAIINDWVKLLLKVVLPSLESEFKDSILEVSDERKAMLVVSTRLRQDLILYNKLNAEVQEDHKHSDDAFRMRESISYIENLTY